jgi:nucleotide-binding universal stress UspA family protein
MYATIFTYFSSPQTADALAEAGVQLAARQGAHLIGAHNSATVSLYGRIPADILAQNRAGQQKEAGAIEAIFTKAAKDDNVSHEWRHRFVKDTHAIDDIIEQARMADLVIACPNDAADIEAGLHNVPVRLALETGRPVLLIPAGARPGSIGRRIALAWSPSRESARAVFDALPLLKDADGVTVISVKTSDAGTAEPARDIVAALARHKIEAEAVVVKASDRTEGAELLAAAQSRGCDLLVMGCYGHSKLREMVLGGVTSHVLKHLTMPLLVAH